jgi:hypothetical protein
MKKIITILFFVLLFFSCARKYNITSVFSKGIPADMQQWKLDSSYHLYIREVFLDTTNPGDKSVKNSNESFSTSDKLIEIEYLLFSPQSGKAVYIATIPDKYLSYYAKKGKYLPRQYLNAYDFSTFRFGKKIDNEDEIVFANTKHSDTWKYKIEDDSILHVYEVVERINGDANVYLVDEALSRNASFIKLANYKIAFRNMDKERKLEKKKRGRKPDERFSKDSIIYYRNDGGKYTIYFRFNKSLPKNYKDSTISFGNNRLVNTPFQ